MTSYGLQATTNPNRPYQGYPYVNPVGTDAPSLNPDEVAARSKWKDLPIKKIGSAAKNPDDNPVIYIDIPAENETSPAPTQTQPRPAPPVPKSPSTGSSAPKPPRHSEDTPVLYIDIPESNGSEVSQSRVEEEREPEYVQETILYDPFKDRRISLSNEDDSDADSVTPESNDRRPPRRPLPPSNLNVASSEGSSGYGGSSSNPSISQSIPPFLSKEAYVYGRQPTPDDGFPLSPIPVSEFGKPPPSYDEIHRTPPPSGAVVEQPRPQEPAPPPTQVITSPNYPGVVGMPHHDRKYLQCQHCSSRVHTLVIRENGPVTHFCAWSFMLCCLCPLVAIIYCMKFWKYRNHYCPNCNKKIGYQLPVCCKELTYVNED